jgi:amidase
VNGELNAVIHPLFDDARELAAGELPDGPFKGVPLLMKDLGPAFAGHPMHLGMRFLKEAGFRSPLDTYLAQRFQDAGFVTVGRTNTPELGILPTTEPDAYGPTHNPWDLSRSPAGSSGARQRRSPRAWSRSPMPTMAGVPSGFPPAPAGSSA